MPTTQPSSMAAAASCGLGTSGGKVKATLPLGVIEDDNNISCLTETGRDQRQHEGAAVTGRNSLANATNYPKLAAVTAITIKGCLASPKLPWKRISDSTCKSIPAGLGGRPKRIPRCPPATLQASTPIADPETSKGESGNVLWTNRKRRSWKNMWGEKLSSSAQQGK